MRLPAAVAAFAVLALSAPAAAQPATDREEAAAMRPGEGRDCFRANSLRRYAVIDDHNVRIRFSPGRTYTLTTSENASDLKWGRGLTLTSDTGWVCTGDVRGAVYVTGGDMGNRYAIDTVTRDVRLPPDASSEEDGN